MKATVWGEDGYYDWPAFIYLYGEGHELAIADDLVQRWRSAMSVGKSPTSTGGPA